jgi:DeoR/GlpR family transcriptional regulator of sugar metabolism
MFRTTLFTRAIMRADTIILCAGTTILTLEQKYIKYLPLYQIRCMTRCMTTAQSMYTEPAVR